jgi:hypothetical protein
MSYGGKVTRRFGCLFLAVIHIQIWKDGADKTKAITSTPRRSAWDLYVRCVRMRDSVVLLGSRLQSSGREKQL